MLSSDDYGATFAVPDVTGQFKAHGNGAGRQNGERLAVDPNDGSVLFTGTRANGLFRSADHGATWARVASAKRSSTAIPTVPLPRSATLAGSSTLAPPAGLSKLSINMRRLACRLAAQPDRARH